MKNCDIVIIIVKIYMAFSVFKALLKMLYMHYSNSFFIATL